MHDNFDAPRQARICRVLIINDAEIVFLGARYSKLMIESNSFDCCELKEKTFRDIQEDLTTGEHDEPNPVPVFISHWFIDYQNRTCWKKLGGQVLVPYNLEFKIHP